MLSEELGFQEFLEDRQGRPCSGRSFHHRETTREKSLDYLKRGVGTARRQSCDKWMDRVVTKAFARALKLMGAVPLSTLLANISDF